MQVRVDVDYANRSVKLAGSPKFRLVAAKTIDVLPNGQVICSWDTAFERKFGEDKWKEFITSGYDISILDIPQAAQIPVKDFDKLVRETRAPRIRVMPE